MKDPIQGEVLSGKKQSRAIKKIKNIYTPPGADVLREVIDFARSPSNPQVLRFSCAIAGDDSDSIGVRVHE
jgi:hypothetical protein